MGKADNRDKIFEVEQLKLNARIENFMDQNSNLDHGQFFITPDPFKDTQKFLPLGGGVVSGAIGYNTSKITIASGAIDIGANSGKYAGHIVLTSESGTTDTLTTINNFQLENQHQVLQAASGHTITIVSTDNIDLSSSITLTNQDTVEIFFDIANNKWRLVGGSGSGSGSQTPWLSNIDAATFDLTNLDSLAFQSTAGTLSSLNVGFSALGAGGFRGNILNNGRFEWTEENTELMRLSEATSITTLKLTGIVSSQINLAETTASKLGTILQGSTTLQYTTTGTQHEFVVGVESIAFINSSGISMQGTNFITTPQIGFSILGNIIEDDTGGMIFKTPVGDDYNWGDGTDVFGTLDKELFALQFASMQIPKIAVPSDPGINTAGKVFYNTTNNRLSFRRRNDGDTAFETINLESISFIGFTADADLNMGTFDINNLDQLEQEATGASLVHTFARPETLADDTTIGEIRFRAFDGLGTINNYASIRGIMKSDVNAGEDGILQFYVAEAGVHDVLYMEINGNNNLEFVQFHKKIQMSADLRMGGNSLVLDTNLNTTIEGFTADTIKLNTNSALRMQITNTATNILGNLINFGSRTFDLTTNVPMASGIMGITRIDTGPAMVYNVPTSNLHQFKVADVNALIVRTDRIDFYNPLVFAAVDALANDQYGLGYLGSGIVELNAPTTVNLTIEGVDAAIIGRDYIQFSEVASDPAAGTTSGKFYVKTVGGLAKPFFIGDGTAAVDLSDAAGGGANTALSNLASVAINTALLPNSDGALNLGSAAFAWNDVFAERYRLEVGGSVTNSANTIIADTGGMILNTPSGDRFEFNINGQPVGIAIDEEEIQFLTSGRQHKFSATATALQIIAENETDAVEIWTGASRTNATIEVNDTTTTWLTETDDVQAILLQLIQNNDTPADSRTLTNLDFMAENSVSANQIFGRISVSSQDITDATEDGLMQLGVMSAGTLVSAMDMEGGTSSSDGAKISFYGQTPVARQTLSATPTNTELSTVLRNLGLTKL